MSWTKRQLLDAAFEELALASYVFDLSPDEQNSALRKLDSMLATWGAAGIRLGYNATVDPGNSDPDQESGIPDWANEAVYLNAAVRMAAGFGKNLSRATVSAAKYAYDLVLSKCMSAIPEIKPMGNLPIGAGFKRRNSPNPFVGSPADRLTTGADGLLDFNGEVPLP